MLSTKAQSLAKQLFARSREERLEEVTRLAKLRDSKSDRLLIELVEHRDVSLREWILDSLWEFGSLDAARKAARIGIRAKNNFVRDIAVQMLGQVGTLQDAAALIQVLQTDKDWVVRCSAASSLGDLRTKGGESALALSVAKDRYWTVRAWATNAIVRTHDKKHEPLLLERIKKEPEPAVLPSLYDAMIELGHDEFAEKLIDLLFVSDYWYMVYLRTCVVLEGLYIDAGKPLPARAIQGLRKVIKYDVGMAAKWSARDLLKKAGIMVRVPAKKST